MPLLKFPNGRKKYVLKNITTGEIINRDAAYPTAEDGGPIVGFDPDLRYYEKWTDLRPTEDPRLFTLSTEENVEVIEEDGAPETEVFHTTWKATKRPVDDLKHAAKNAESLRNKEQVPDSEQLKVIVSVLRILKKRLNNQTLTQKEAEKFARFDAVADTIEANDEYLATLFTKIDNGEIPDVDAWPPTNQ